MNASTVIAVAVATALLGLPAGAAGQAPCCNDAVAVPTVQPDVDKRPNVEQMVVTFRDPVLVGDRILMGKYVIEHDMVRMARGWPCTYIYDYDDRRLPVVAFHCTHLKRDRRAAPTVTLVSVHAAGMKRFTEFQFAGEAAGHGVPGGR